jgi:hemerythrin-like domain-containing protein
MTPKHDDHPAVIETRVVHDVHRRATSLLADALHREAPIDEAAALRDFVVAMLRHHHQSEDTDLWPILMSVAPKLSRALHELSREHEDLDAQLDALQRARIVSQSDLLRPMEQAAAVRDLVHLHLSREEPFLFPALERHLSDEAWGGFSQRTVASAPAEGTHLLVAFLDEVGSPRDVEMVLRHVPPAAKDLLPVMRGQGQAALAALRPRSLAGRTGKPR